MIDAAVNIGIILVWIQAGIGMVLVAVLCASFMVDIILRHGDFDREFFNFLVAKARGRTAAAAVAAEKAEAELKETDDKNDEDGKNKSTSGE